MCGIVGFWGFGSFKSYNLADVAAKMAQSINFRGPDDERVWTDEREHLALAHRRLAILDLSAKGSQPMISSLGRYVIIFNGEVYNATELKQELRQLGYTFKGTSDTEVMLSCFEEWGIASSARRFQGMFAFAVWDRERRCLSLVRDRLGVKPLYYGRIGTNLFFGSQPKAFFAHPEWEGELNLQALESYFHLHYVPTPLSIYRNIYKLDPGTILTYSQDGEATCETYWDLSIVTDPLRVNYSLTEAEAIEQLDYLLKDSVQKRMIADVPLGAFLSGGIDSSLIVALMQKIHTDPVKTFSVKFLDANFDESFYASQIAQHIGTDHKTFEVSAKEAQNVIPHLYEYFDEPFADSSQIPTYLISKLAREHVKVSLSGDGGDEIFAGYYRYVWGSRFWNYVKYIPYPVRYGFSVFAEYMVKNFGSRGIQYFLKDVSSQGIEDKILKSALILRSQNEKNLIVRTADQGGISEQYVRRVSPFYGAYAQNSPLKGLALWQYTDTKAYLPDDILTKLDRSTMAVSLEGREPFLDYRIVEWAWRLPNHMKIRNGQTKWLLKKVLQKYVPKELFDRPKMGFNIPLAQWLRTDLKTWAEAQIMSMDQTHYHYLNCDLLKKQWQYHQDGKVNFHNQIWATLMFLQWEQHYLSSKTTSMKFASSLT